MAWLVELFYRLFIHSLVNVNMTFFNLNRNNPNWDVIVTHMGAPLDLVHSQPGLHELSLECGTFFLIYWMDSTPTNVFLG